MTTKTTRKMTIEQADEIILASEYGDRVEDCEYNKATKSWVYTLDDGSAVAVSADGTIAPCQE